MKDYNNDICTLVREMKGDYKKQILSMECNEIIKKHLEDCEDCKKEYEVVEDSKSGENNKFKTISNRLRKRRIKNIIIAIVIVLVVFFAYQISFDKFLLVGGMEPEIKSGESLYSYRFAYTFSNPKRNDVVAFKNNSFIDVSRIVALPDDIVEIKNDNLYINGELVNGYEEIKAYQESKYYKDGEYSVKVPKDCYYVIGDNLENSFDSRYDFFVDKKDICGKVIFHISSFHPFVRQVEFVVTEVEKE